MADGPGLAGDAPAFDQHVDVEAVRHLHQLERLPDDHHAGLAAEELIQWTPVDGDRSLAGLQEDARRRRLAPAGRDGCARCHGGPQISSCFGCCATCGCALPANTWSFLNICRPRIVFGSMPLTAYSIARSGCCSRSLPSATVFRLPR